MTVRLILSSDKSISEPKPIPLQFSSKVKLALAISGVKEALLGVHEVVKVSRVTISMIREP